jgi:hypothetical protein
MNYETRLEMISMHVWEKWTNNGLNLDEDDRLQTIKSAQDAACNAYHFLMSDQQWLDATLNRLMGAKS